jgi:hypothetical protein
VRTNGQYVNQQTKDNYSIKYFITKFIKKAKYAQEVHPYFPSVVNKKTTSKRHQRIEWQGFEARWKQTCTLYNLFNKEYFFLLRIGSMLCSWCENCQESSVKAIIPGKSLLCTVGGKQLVKKRHHHSANFKCCFFLRRSQPILTAIWMRSLCPGQNSRWGYLGQNFWGGKNISAVVHKSWLKEHT